VRKQASNQQSLISYKKIIQQLYDNEEEDVESLVKISQRIANEKD
jgi:hypothetical protein